MVEESTSDEGIINSGHLPDKPTHEFSLEELKLIMDNNPAGMIELFDRSDWETDDAGRKSIIKNLRDKVLMKNLANLPLKLLINLMIYTVRSLSVITV